MLIFLERMRGRREEKEIRGERRKE